jgi:hypothetical protein
MLRFSMALAICSAIALVSPAAAQQGPGGGVNPQRDCQTILTCQYARTGSFRGCVSSYSCRSCNFVTAKCAIPGGGRKVCREMRCGWGA